MEKSASIRVLVVDDSLFMRTLISDMLNSDPDIKVIDTAKDGRDALKKISKARPDCITLDIAMPGWDGFTTLENIMTEYPTPVIILSAHSKKDADITIKCLNAGAFGFILKPSGELSLNIKDVKHELIEQVKAASRVSPVRIKSLMRSEPSRSRRRLIAVDRIIVIGASTGGPQTLEIILCSLPANLPVPIIVIQHMPSKFFTESLAEHLNKVSNLEVNVADNGKPLRPGKVYLVPGGFQARIDTNIRVHPFIGPAYISVLEEKSEVLSPSIDVTMKSVAEIYGRNTIGIILSGMGEDGREGMRAIKESGGKTIAQDESSLIFGMPKAVIESGYADKVLPAEEIAGELVGIVESMW